MLPHFKPFWFSIIILLQFIAFKSLGNTSSDLIFYAPDTAVAQLIIAESNAEIPAADTLKHIKENKRVIAIALIIIGGPLGFHRIYLGTKPFVPIFYALTLGGGFGILPLLDLIALIKTKDLKVLENNPKVLMWLE